MISEMIIKIRSLLKGVKMFLHTVEKSEFCSKIFLGSGYSKIFQLTIWVSKLDLRDLKSKIVKEFLTYWI